MYICYIRFSRLICAFKKNIDRYSSCCLIGSCYKRRRYDIKNNLPWSTVSYSPVVMPQQLCFTCIRSSQDGTIIMNRLSLCMLDSFFARSSYSIDYWYCSGCVYMETTRHIYNMTQHRNDWNERNCIELSFSKKHTHSHTNTLSTEKKETDEE